MRSLPGAGNTGPAAWGTFIVADDANQRSSARWLVDSWGDWELRRWRRQRATGHREGLGDTTFTGSGATNPSRYARLLLWIAFASPITQSRKMRTFFDLLRAFG